MASHLRSHSTASSTGSLTDDLLYSGSASAPLGGGGDYAYGASGAGDASFAYSDGGGSPLPDLPSSRRSSVSHHPAAAPHDTPKLGAAGAGRSRARAFSFLSVRGGAGAGGYGERGDAAGGLSPHSGETPFVGGAYDFALDGEGDEVDALGDDALQSDYEDEGTEMREVGAATAGGAKTGGYRNRFQPLVGHELAWMGVSAAAVTGLTVAAVVLACVG
ncbi:hypothetical protein JCM10449v2_008218 [Rhodotorula kratochvilovae]